MDPDYSNICQLLIQKGELKQQIYSSTLESMELFKQCAKEFEDYYEENCAEQHPRVTVDYNGKNLGNSGSPGMTFADLSTLCASMGMKAAYNLDGGRSIGMYWNGKLFGHNMRAIGDIIAVTD